MLCQTMELADFWYINHHHCLAALDKTSLTWRHVNSERFIFSFISCFADSNIFFLAAGFLITVFLVVCFKANYKRVRAEQQAAAQRILGFTSSDPPSPEPPSSPDPLNH